MGPDDIVTPIIPPVDGHVPRNYNVLGASELSPFRNHMRAVDIRERVGPEVFAEYTKFCVEREPVAKCINHYSMQRNSPDHGQGKKGLTSDAYVSAGPFPRSDRIYTDDRGKLLVDKICKFENLNAELASLAGSLGFEFDGLHARAKSGLREPISPTDAQRRTIYKAFRKSLKHCPYDSGLKTGPAWVLARLRNSFRH